MQTYYARTRSQSLAAHSHSCPWFELNSIGVEVTDAVVATSRRHTHELLTRLTTFPQRRVQTHILRLTASNCRHFSTQLARSSRKDSSPSDDQARDQSARNDRGAESQRPKSTLRRKGVISSLYNLLTQHKTKTQAPGSYHPATSRGPTALPPEPTKVDSAEKQEEKKDGQKTSSPDQPHITAEIEPRITNFLRRETEAERWNLRKHGKSFSVWQKRNAQEQYSNTAKDIILFGTRHKRLIFPPRRAQQNNSRRSHTPFDIMRSVIQVVTTPTADTPGTTLLLQSANKRYLLGSVAEGTQRAAMQAGAKFIKVSEFFITGRTEWRNIGGLIGVILTLADSLETSNASAVAEAVKKMRSRARREGYADDEARLKDMEDDIKASIHNNVTFFGPPNLNYTLATTRRYVFRRGMPVDIHEIRDDISGNAAAAQRTDWSPSWSDDTIMVWSMSVAPSGKAPIIAPKPVSPRKRSIEEVEEPAENRRGAPWTSLVQNDLSPEQRDYLTVKAVVNEMFNSSWRLDTLHETRLADVKLPASIFIRDTENHKIIKYTGPIPDGKSQLPDPDLKVLVRRPWPGALIESLPPPISEKNAISYIIKNQPSRGKFDVQRAKQLKVKPGPNYRALTMGESVLSETGETVTPDMVMGASKEGGGAAVIDLPSLEYIDNLISRPEWQQEKVMSGVGAIFWICGPGVAIDPRIHDFMRRYKHMEHIVSSSDYCPNRIALESTAGSTVRLRALDPDRYGVPVHDSATAGKEQLYGGSNLAASNNNAHPLPAGVHIAARGQALILEPYVKFETDKVVPDFDVAAEQSLVPPSALEEATKAREIIAAPDDGMKAWLETLPPGAKDAEVITLGTGSALPSKYRNVSATMVRVPGWGNLLFDCGENTIGQLKRVFTEAEFKDVLRNLRLITISHMHADHQLGTTSMIKAWYEEVHGCQPGRALSPAELTTSFDAEALFRDQNRLAIVSEPAMQAWLYEYSFAEDFGYSRLAPLVLPTIMGNAFSSSKVSDLAWYIPKPLLNALSDEAKQERGARLIDPSLLGLKAIDAVSVSHCHGARAISITFPSGFKVSFSGDCRPSKQFMQIGKGSTVCIHEATFDDELRGDAIAKKHSTTSEALGVAEGMNARACVLTHFSQRYQKVPILERSPDAPSAADAAAVDVEADVAASDETPDDPSLDAEGPGGDPAQELTYADPGPATDAGKQYDVPDAGPRKRGFAQPSKPGDVVKLQIKSDMKVCVAFDYMRVKVGDIGNLEKFTPALVELFATEGDEAGGDNDSNGGDVADAKNEDKKKNKNSQRRN